MAQATGTVVWRRRVDEGRYQRRMQRFWRFYVAPVALLIVVVAILAGVGAAAGLLILLGAIGALLFVWFWLDGRNERANPTVTLEAGQLRWAKRRVPIDQVTRFNTYQDSTSVEVGRGSMGSGVTASATLGTARFVLVDGTEVRFAWVGLDDRQLAELRTALEEVLPGRWRSLEALRQAD
jgi:membrane-associated phospholipid phosphatase